MKKKNQIIIDSSSLEQASTDNEDLPELYIGQDSETNDINCLVKVITSQCFQLKLLLKH